MCTHRLATVYGKAMFCNTILLFPTVIRRDGQDYRMLHVEDGDVKICASIFILGDRLPPQLPCCRCLQLSGLLMICCIYQAVKQMTLYVYHISI